MTLAMAAISVSKEIEKYGAYAGLAAIVGLGVLSLLYFAQAREVKRLREWAGRAPERAAELEARVATEAARRASSSPLRPQTPAAQAAARPVSASAVAGPASPAPAAQEAGEAKPPGAPVPGLPIPVPAASGTAGAPAPAASTATPESPPTVVTPGATPPTAPSAGETNGASAKEAEPPGPRVPGRPPPASPSPIPTAASAATEAPASRALRGDPPSRTLPPHEDEPGGRGRPSGRVLGILGGVGAIAVAVAVVLALTLGGGKDTPPPPNRVSETVGRTSEQPSTRTHSTRQARIDRADTPVEVLNATGVNGLARQVADRLQSTGYQAAVDNTQPRPATVIGYKSGAEAAAREIGRLLQVPSAQIQPMPTDLAGVAGTNAVVVVIGADKATD